VLIKLKIFSLFCKQKSELKFIKGNKHKRTYIGQDKFFSPNLFSIGKKKELSNACRCVLLFSFTESLYSCV